MVRENARIPDDVRPAAGARALRLAEKDGHRFALKIVHPHLLDTPGFFKRFLREAEIGKTVVHPNVVRTVDCDALGGHHLLAGRQA